MFLTKILKVVPINLILKNTMPDMEISDILYTAVFLVLLRLSYLFLYIPYTNYRFYRKQNIRAYIILPFGLYNAVPKQERADPKL
jgi:hypothetical protein